MKAKPIINAVSIAVIAIGIIPSSLALVSTTKKNHELVQQYSNVADEKKQHSDKLSGIINSFRSEDTTELDVSDKVMVTNAILSKDTTLSEITVYDSAGRKLSVLENASDVSELPQDNYTLEYNFYVNDVESYLKELATFPIVYSDVLTIPLNGQVILRVAFGGGTE